jgi:predicted RecA/RadA family phage recombinase
MIARYVCDGSTIDHRPTVDINAGDILTFGGLVGIARLDVKAGELGAFALTGIYDIKKPTGVAYTTGTLLYWDASAKTTSTTTSHPKLGHVVASALTDDETVRVRIG